MLFELRAADVTTDTNDLNADENLAQRFEDDALPAWVRVRCR